MKLATFRYLATLIFAIIAISSGAQQIDPRQDIDWTNVQVQVLFPPASGASTSLIQSALNGTANEVYLSAGTYTSDRLSLNRSNVTVQGAGQGVTIIQAACPLTLSPQEGGSGGLFYAWPTSGSLSNVHVKDATLIGCDSTVNITSVTLSGTVATITATNTLTAGENVGFNGLVGGATVALNGGGFWTVLSAGLSGSQFEVSYTSTAGGPYTQTAANFWLWNGTAVTYPTHQGIVLDGCYSCSVENVAVENMGAESILFDPSAIGDSPVAQNDTVVGGAGNSISSNFAYGAHFLNNTIINVFGGNCLGWSGDATVATGNIIHNCSGDGINSGGSGYVHDVLGYDAEISSNIIDGAHSCIHLSDDGATVTTTRWYDIANNTCTNYNYAGFLSDLTQASDVIFVKGLNVTGGGMNAAYGGTIGMGFDGGAATYYISNVHLIGSGLSTGQVFGIYAISGSPILYVNGNVFLNNIDGDVAQALAATPTIHEGVNTFTSGTQSGGPFAVPFLTPLVIYSAHGTVLTACSSSNVGSGGAVVSDATSLTPGTTYSPTAGAGTDTVSVQCALTGSTYAWQTE